MRPSQKSISEQLLSALNAAPYSIALLDSLERECFSRIRAERDTLPSSVIAALFVAAYVCHSASSHLDRSNASPEYHLLQGETLKPSLSALFQSVGSDPDDQIPEKTAALVVTLLEFTGT